MQDPEYIKELHNIINKVLERYDTFAKVRLRSAPVAAECSPSRVFLPLTRVRRVACHRRSSWRCAGQWG